MSLDDDSHKPTGRPGDSQGGEFSDGPGASLEDGGFVRWLLQQPTSVRWILALKFLESWAYFLVNNIFTLYLTELWGYSDEGAGLAFGVRGTLSTLYGAVLGPVIDHVGITWSLRLAFLITTLSRGAMAVVPTRRSLQFIIFGLLPMGHALASPALTIAMKRCSSRDGSGSQNTKFAMLYLTLVLGIAVCGPTIDFVTILISSHGHQGSPYVRLLLLCSGVSGAGLFISAVFLRGLDEADQMQPLRQGGRMFAICKAAVRDTLPHVCSFRFARFAAFGVLSLPAHLVVRNLDGGLFPKYMVRSFGRHVPKGSIYAINPVLDILLVLPVARWSRGVVHHRMLVAGFALAALSPFAVAALGSSLASTVLFIVVLTAGDLLYSPRLDAYAMAVAPDGHEGAFMAVSHMLLFAVDIPVGLIGGELLARFCPAPTCQVCHDGSVCDAAELKRWTQDCPDCFCKSSCNARAMFGLLGLTACISPLLLCIPWWVEPTQHGVHSSTEIPETLEMVGTQRTVVGRGIESLE